MKVQPIDPANTSQTAKIKHPGFKGLWGKSDHYVYANDSAATTLIKHHYYPFKDEPFEQIRDITASKTMRFVSDWKEAEGLCTYNDISVYIQKLPFTQNEYVNYLSKKQVQTADIAECKEIESCLRENGLKKYLNKNKKFRNQFNKLVAEELYPKSQLKQFFHKLKGKIFL